MRAWPWRWTDLPVPHADTDHRVDDGSISVLSPMALRDLVRFVRGQGQRAGAPVKPPE